MLVFCSPPSPRTNSKEADEHNTPCTVFQCAHGRSRFANAPRGILPFPLFLSRERIKWPHRAGSYKRVGHSIMTCGQSLRIDQSQPPAGVSSAETADVMFQQHGVLLTSWSTSARAAARTQRDRRADESFCFDDGTAGFLASVTFFPLASCRR
jgi:hypothetical protein